MPAKSKKQYNYMQMMAHSPEVKKRGGPSRKMAKKIIEGTPKKKKMKYSSNA